MELSPDDLIPCMNQKGEPMRLPRADFSFRPGAYGVINHDGALLVVKLPTGKYFLPGGGVDLGETLVDALRREVREEVGGLEIKVGEPLGTFEHFYYYDDTQSAWHAICHVYICDTVGDISAGAGTMEEGYPEWVPLENLTDDVLHPGIMKRVVETYRDFLSIKEA